MKILPVGILSALALTLVAGCGGGGGMGGTCANVAACGGNIVGTWSVTSSCVSGWGTMFDGNCPASMSSAKVSINGTVTFAGDMTYTANGTTSPTISLAVPASCLTAQGLTCDQLSQIIAGTCMPSSGGGCTCTTVIPSTWMESGTYAATMAGLLTEMAADGTSNPADYCATGNTLTISPHTGSTMFGVKNSGTVTVTLSKR